MDIMGRKTLGIFFLNQIKYRLVINELNMLVVNSFGLIKSFFELECVLIEVLLKFFVGEVNAQLLETVFLEYLKAKYIEDTWTGQELQGG